MTLIRLECGDLNRCVRTLVISVIEMWIYWWREDQSWLLGWENWSLIIDISRRWFIVPDYSIWIDTWCSWWLLKLWVDRFISIIFSTSMRFWVGYIYEIVYWLELSRLLLKVTGKSLFDRNTLYSPIVHRIHGYCYRSLLLILFTVYTIIDWLLLYGYRYCHRIVPVL